MAQTHYYTSDVGNVDDDRTTIQTRSEKKFVGQSTNHDRLEKKELNKAEQRIQNAINSAIKNWYEPWKMTYLAGSREFKIVYDLMEGLLHYEYQVTSCDSTLSEERTRAIAQAVARLVDYGNALLGSDIIVRTDNDPLKELDPNSSTTIQLYRAYLKAHNLREKLLYDYFKKDKPNKPYNSGEDDLFTGNLTPFATLQVPSSSAHSTSLGNTLERGYKSMGGSNNSINTIPDGVKTSIQPLLDLKMMDHEPKLESDVTQMLLLLKSSEPQGSTRRAIALLPSILAKVESLLSMPTSVEKITSCFELLDALLDYVERLPAESRNQEVMMVSSSLLKPLVKKVYIDDRENLVEFQHTHWTICLLSIIRVMNATDFNNYLKHFSNVADLGAFLKDYLFIIKRLISTSKEAATSLHPDLDTRINSSLIFPSCWIEMSLLACSTFLASLTYLYQVLGQLFPSNLAMWTSFVDCLVHFILQETLKPGRPMLKQRQLLLAEDLRQRSAEYVWISWDSLNIDQKQQLLEELIEPLLRAALVLNSRQRSILLPIFYDMMRCDYTSQYITPRASVCASTSSNLNSHDDANSFIYQDDLESLPPTNQQDYISHSNVDQALPYLAYRDLSLDGTVLTKFTHLVVGKLNILMIEQDLGDEPFRDELCAAIAGDLNPKYYNRNSFTGPNILDTTRFKNMARQTADLIFEFIQICLDARQANRLSYKHLYMLCLFRLVLFFKDKVDIPESYLNNLYKLCHLHHSAGRYVEAGYTLLEHAKALPWSDRPLENHFRMVNRFFQTPQPLVDYNGLKIFLYDTIISYFDQGQLWEPAIPLCRELVDLYEFKTFEYTKLADLLQRMSSYFSSMVEPGKRNNPEYFRVTFYGAGFPSSLRNATTVYRGKPYEKLGDFQATLMTKYPDAQLLKSLSKPEDSMLAAPEARYLQINACSPIVDLKSKLGVNLMNIEERILDYYRHNECDKFQFTRRISAPHNFQNNPARADRVTDDNFANMWRERTTLTTNSLPGILPFFPAYLIETSLVSPIESAIEDLERTNDRLSCMVNRFKADKRQEEDVRLLGQLLLGVVDAAVNGGITKYEEAFFNGNDISTSTATSLSSASKSTTVANNLESSFGALYFGADETRRRTLSSHIGANNALQYTRLQLVRDGGDNVAGPSADQVDKLKRLIAQQVPLLDEGVRLHRDRVAEIMRPQHEHLEASYKKLKHNVMTKYAKHLPPDYSRSTMRSYRSLARSPNRSIRSESRLPLSNTIISAGAKMKRDRDADATTKPIPMPPNNSSQTSSNIPYRQLANDRRSLPFISCEPMASSSIDVSRDQNYSATSGLPSVASLQSFGEPPPRPTTPKPPFRISLAPRGGGGGFDESQDSLLRKIGVIGNPLHISYQHSDSLESKGMSREMSSSAQTQDENSVEGEDSNLVSFL